jgi:streptogramin lyase
VQVVSFAHSDTNHTTPLGTAVTDVSGGSGACVASGGSRTCTVAVSAPPGNDDFVFTLYDTAPSSGVIPPAAHVLGTAGVTQTLVAGSANTVNAPINAVIVGLSGQAALVPLAADGVAQNVGLTIAPTDFGNNAITAGSSNAPFANPITVALTESGGSGHAALQLNGGSPAASVTVSKSTDTVQVVYDGGGAAGYQAAVALTAPAYAGEGPATENAVVKPVLFVTNKTVFWASTPAQVLTYPEGQHVLSISEPTAAGGTAYTATPAGCTNILSVGTVVGTGTAATLLVVGGTTISSSGCSLAISDGTTSYQIAVSNTLRPLGTPSIAHEYATTANHPASITTGADGNLWFSEFSGVSVSSINSTGAGYTTHSLNSAGFQNPAGVALGPDGNVWAGDYNTNKVAQITPAGTITTFSGQTSNFTNYVSAGLDGLTWFSECAGTLVGSLSTTGTLHEVGGVAGSQGVALGPDGNIWFTQVAPARVGRIAGGVATVFTASLSGTAFGITAGSDGALWFLEPTHVGRMTTSGTLTEYAIPGTPSAISFYSGYGQSITAAPDGAVWFTDTGNNAIDRITTAGSITQYPIPTSASTPGGITVGPDGNLWFTEYGTGKIGVLQL